MSVKSIILKIAAAVLVICALLGVILFLSGEEEIVTEESVTVYASNEADISRVIVKGSDEFSFVKQDEAWIMEGMEGIKVNNAYASALVKSMANISSPMIVGLNLNNLSDYGFDNPNVSVKLIYKNSEETIRIGNQSGEYYYLNVMSTKDVYLMPKSDLFMALLSKMDYLDLVAVKINSEKIEKITIGDIELETINGEWYEKSPYSRMAEADKVKNILSLLSEVTSEEIIAFENIVHETKMRKIIYVKAEGNDEETQFYVCPYDDSYSYLWYPDAEYAYKVSSKSLSFVEATPFELILKYAAPVAITDVVNVELIQKGNRCALSIEAPSTEAPVFYKNGEEAVEESFRSFYQKLMGLTFTGEGKADSPAEYAIVFTKENGEKLDLRFLPASDSEYAVSINGKTEFTVLKKSVTDIFEALNEIELV